MRQKISSSTTMSIHQARNGGPTRTSGGFLRPFRFLESILSHHIDAMERTCWAAHAGTGMPAVLASFGPFWSPFG